MPTSYQCPDHNNRQRDTNIPPLKLHNLRSASLRHRLADTLFLEHCMSRVIAGPPRDAPAGSEDAWCTTQDGVLSSRRPTVGDLECFIVAHVQSRPIAVHTEGAVSFTENSFGHSPTI